MASSNKKNNRKATLERFAMRVPSTLKQKYEQAAALRGETITGWAKAALAEAADKHIKEHEFLNMALQDRLAFAEAIISPPKPTKVAVDAAKHYKKVFGL